MSFNPANLTPTGTRNSSELPFYYVYSTSDTTSTIQSTQGYFNGGNLRKGDTIRVAASDATKMYRVTDDSSDINIQFIETL